MFSVVIPLYNKAQFIKRAIDSVLSQSFEHFEVIVIDDGSTDGGGDLIEESYGEKVILIKQANSGVSVARNTGIKHAKQPYIAFLDADDFWSPYYLEKNAEIILNENEIRLIGSAYTRRINDLELEDKTLGYQLIKDYFKIAIRNTLFFTSATVIPRSFFEKNEGFNVILKRGEDLDLWFRAMLIKGNAFLISNTLVYYSSEDLNQETRILYNLNNTLVGNAIDFYKPYFKENLVFEKFISKYVYFNLYPYFYSEKNHIQSKEALKRITDRYFFLEVVYKIPFVLGNKIIKNPKLRRYFRLYLKFFLRKVYKC